LIRLAVGGGLLAGPAAAARADGGAVRASAAAGGWRVTVFTDPTPPRAGPVDVSVLVQDAATGRPDPAARVWVRAAPRDRDGPAVEGPATADAATNKLMVAAALDLPEPGWWAVRVRVEGGGRSAEVAFDVEVGGPPPRWPALAGWVGWPALAVALFAAHRVLVRRRGPRPG
jgi:hypothetical protein